MIRRSFYQILLASGFTLVAVSSLAADKKIPFSFKNEDVTKVIEVYAKGSSEKFIIDPGVRAKITILNNEAIDLPEAFHQMSVALAVNGFALVRLGDGYVVRTARNAQRDLLEVTTTVPSVKPEKMVTYIHTLKNVPATNVMREVRVLQSKDGEMSANESTNQLIISDFSSNIIRIVEILKTIDQKTTPEVAALIAQAKKEAAVVEKAEKKETK